MPFNIVSQNDVQRIRQLVGFDTNQTLRDGIDGIIDLCGRVIIKVIKRLLAAWESPTSKTGFAETNVTFPKEGL